MGLLLRLLRGAALHGDVAKVDILQCRQVLHNSPEIRLALELDPIQVQMLQRCCCTQVLQQLAARAQVHPQALSALGTAVI